MSDALVLEGLHKSFGKHEVLRGIDLDGRRARGRVPDRRVGLRASRRSCAASTCSSRSTRAGSSSRARRSPRAASTSNRISRGIGIVFQAYNLFPHMSVLRNVTLAPRKVLEHARAAKPRRARSSCSSASGSRTRRDDYPGPALGRPAAARRDRARARDAAGPDAARRGDERARPGARRRGAGGDPRARRRRDDDADRDARDVASRATSPTASASSTTA